MLENDSSQHEAERMSDSKALTVPTFQAHTPLKPGMTV